MYLLSIWALTLNVLRYYLVHAGTLVREDIDSDFGFSNDLQFTEYSKLILENDSLENEVVELQIYLKSEFRSSVSDPRRLWIDGIVPYKVSEKFDSKQKSMIQEAVDEFKEKSCVSFIPHTNETQFLVINTGKGCGAVLGKVPGGSSQSMKLANGCFSKGILLHELMHVLGFIHEHNRPDRDDYVKIIHENIMESKKSQFSKRSWDDVQTFNLSYDYNSIMHYGPYVFAKNRSEPTIVPLIKGKEIGQRTGFSDLDILKINKLYNCEVNGSGVSLRQDDDVNDYYYEDSKPVVIHQVPPGVHLRQNFDIEDMEPIVFHEIPGMDASFNRDYDFEDTAPIVIHQSNSFLNFFKPSLGLWKKVSIPKSEFMEFFFPPIKKPAISNQIHSSTTIEKVPKVFKEIDVSSEIENKILARILTSNKIKDVDASVKKINQTTRNEAIKSNSIISVNDNKVDEKVKDLFNIDERTLNLGVISQKKENNVKKLDTVSQSWAALPKKSNSLNLKAKPNDPFNILMNESIISDKMDEKKLNSLTIKSMISQNGDSSFITSNKNEAATIDFTLKQDITKLAAKSDVSAVRSPSMGVKINAPTTDSSPISRNRIKKITKDESIAIPTSNNLEISTNETVKKLKQSNVLFPTAKTNALLANENMEILENGTIPVLMNGAILSSKNGEKLTPIDELSRIPGKSIKTISKDDKISEKESVLTSTDGKVLTPVVKALVNPRDKTKSIMSKTTKVISKDEIKGIIADNTQIISTMARKAFPKERNGTILRDSPITTESGRIAINLEEEKSVLPSNATGGIVRIKAKPKLADRGMKISTERTVVLNPTDDNILFQSEKNVTNLMFKNLENDTVLAKKNISNVKDKNIFLTTENAAHSTEKGIKAFADHTTLVSLNEKAAMQGDNIMAIPISNTIETSTHKITVELKKSGVPVLKDETIIFPPGGNIEIQSSANLLVSSEMVTGSTMLASTDEVNVLTKDNFMKNLLDVTTIIPTKDTRPIIKEKTKISSENEDMEIITQDTMEIPKLPITDELKVITITDIMPESKVNVAKTDAIFTKEVQSDLNMSDILFEKQTAAHVVTETSFEDSSIENKKDDFNKVIDMTMEDGINDEQTTLANDNESMINSHDTLITTLLPFNGAKLTNIGVSEKLKEKNISENNNEVLTIHPLSSNEVDTNSFNDKIIEMTMKDGINNDERTTLAIDIEITNDNNKPPLATLLSFNKIIADETMLMHTAASKKITENKTVIPISTSHENLRTNPFPFNDTITEAIPIHDIKNIPENETDVLASNKHEFSQTKSLRLNGRTTEGILMHIDNAKIFKENEAIVPTSTFNSHEAFQTTLGIISGIVKKPIPIHVDVIKKFQENAAAVPASVSNSSEKLQTTLSQFNELLNEPIPVLTDITKKFEDNELGTPASSSSRPETMQTTLFTKAINEHKQIVSKKFEDNNVREPAKSFDSHDGLQTTLSLLNEAEDKHTLVLTDGSEKLEETEVSAPSSTSNNHEMVPTTLSLNEAEDKHTLVLTGVSKKLEENEPSVPSSTSNNHEMLLTILSVLNEAEDKHTLVLTGGSKKLEENKTSILFSSSENHEIPQTTLSQFNEAISESTSVHTVDSKNVEKNEVRVPVSDSNDHEMLGTTFSVFSETVKEPTLIQTDDNQNIEENEIVIPINNHFFHVVREIDIEDDIVTVKDINLDTIEIPDNHLKHFHKLSIIQAVESRTALSDPKKIWNKGIVPFVLSDKYVPDQKESILAAMKEFKERTCVRFIERTTENSYILIEPENRCAATVGFQNFFPNQVFLDRGCYSRGTILHELMHVLGFVHEQNRPDRDQYVIIVWDNIIPSFKQNFQKYSWSEVQTFNLSYDYDSLMHYDAFEFARDERRPTIIALKPGVKLGQRNDFSKKDLIKINKLYHCDNLIFKEKPLEEKNSSTFSTIIEQFKKSFMGMLTQLLSKIKRTVRNLVSR